MSETMTEHVFALTALAASFEDLNSPEARLLLSAVLPRTEPAQASYAAMLVRQQIVGREWGLISGKTYLQAAHATLADRTGQGLVAVRTT